MNYAVLQRLRLIDFLLSHYGSVSRSEIIDFFGIGPATASRDLADYREKHPANLVFNTISKRYVKADTFERAYP